MAFVPTTTGLPPLSANGIMKLRDKLPLTCVEAIEDITPSHFAFRNTKD